ncbi:MAG: PilN domain-containing protein [Phycisphaerales bacterium]|nr:PilN domain-containing protein [Phycisphaerales bacterium]
MSGVMLDLMPLAIRHKAQAGQRLRRLIAIGVITLGLLVTFSTHSQLRRDRLEEALIVSESRAAQALQLERQAEDLSVVRTEIEAAMNAYDRVALPIRMDRMMGHIVASLPPSATLEHLLLEYEDDRNRNRREQDGDEVERRIVGGISGFAASDDDVARLVQRLDQHEPFEDVRLEFTRSRDVRGTNAREFQMTFTVNLEGSWEIKEPDLAIAEGISP